MNMAVSYPHLDQMQPWNDRLHLLECTSATVEAPEVMTFTFRAEAPVWFRYLPGQFVTLELPVAREPVMRTYTLSSGPMPWRSPSRRKRTASAPAGCSTTSSRV
jgi:NADPH-dependent ferric siderophore reductase